MVHIQSHVVFLQYNLPPHPLRISAGCLLLPQPMECDWVILYDFFESELLKTYIFQGLSTSSDTFPGHNPPCCEDVQDI